MRRREKLCGPQRSSDSLWATLPEPWRLTHHVSCMYHLDEKETAYWAWLKVYPIESQVQCTYTKRPKTMPGYISNKTVTLSFCVYFIFFKPEKNKQYEVVAYLSSFTNLQTSTGIYSTLDDEKRKEKNVNGVRK
jgi:hypothetical protein